MCVRLFNSVVTLAENPRRFDGFQVMLSEAKHLNRKNRPFASLRVTTAALRMTTLGIFRHPTRNAPSLLQIILGGLTVTVDAVKLK
jgi:hypothetical protein